MLAARVYPGKNAFVLEDIPLPEIGPGEVLVKVRAVGLSRGLISVWLFTDMIKLLPATLGHEIAGEAAATGPGVSTFRAGDRVHVTRRWAAGVPTAGRAPKATKAPAPHSR